MALQESGVTKAFISHAQTLKDATPTIPAGMYEGPVPNSAGRSA